MGSEKPSIAVLKNAHAGWPVAVLGAGPSLGRDFMRLPPETVMISVNHHAARLTPCDYMVYGDDPSEERNRPLRLALAVFEGTRITDAAGGGDFVIDVPYWPAGFSGGLACWLACWLGGDPVLLCGMDCYQGARKYFYEGPSDHPAHHYPLENHLKAWRPAIDHCPNSGAVRAVSGPLTDIFGPWRAGLGRLPAPTWTGFWGE